MRSLEWLCLVYDWAIAIAPPSSHPAKKKTKEKKNGMAPSHGAFQENVHLVVVQELERLACRPQPSASPVKRKKLSMVDTRTVTCVREWVVGEGAG